MIRNNKEVFEQISKDYIKEDQHWGSDLDLIKTTFDKLIQKKNNTRWLDIGCGPGFHIVSMGKLYPMVRILGIDYSPLMLQEARKKVGRIGVQNAEFEEKDVTTEKLPRKKYDLVTFLNNGLGNLYRKGSSPEKIREKVIQRIANVLKDNSYFILSVYNREKLDLNYGNKFKLLKNKSDLEKGNLFIEYSPTGKKTIYYAHWFSEEELYDIGNKTGLKIDFLERRMSRFLVRFKKG